MPGPDLLSSQGLRLDGRRPNELRRIRCKLGVFTQPDGSAYLEQGNTKVLAAVYGPHQGNEGGGDNPPTSSSKRLRVEDRGDPKMDVEVGSGDNVNKQDFLPVENIKTQIVSNNDVLMALVQTLVEIGNRGDNSPTTLKTIKDILIKNLK
ncbi:Exosome complex component RRP41 [Papilio xuthus]|uniref:Exosome complex component RRP41 n=1 Tax=Papilio xuthus TaxID=66420 RepID=A0A194PTI3_PAPXU|nr:Exosome complex component RRP41 [Papilio xuthus]